MNIKNQIRLSVLISLILVVVISASIFISYQNVQDLRDQEALAAEVVRGGYELTYLSNDYLINAEPRARVQWEERFISLQPIISQLKSENDEEAQSIALIRDYNEKSGVLFREIPEPGTVSASANLFPASFQQVTWSRINVQSQGMIYEAWRLRHLYNDDVSEARFWNNILVLVLMVLMLIIIGVNYLLISRRLVRSIREVNAGSEVFATGNLDYRIPVTGDDEIGGIAHQLNIMAEQIRAVTASRDELDLEITERKRAEKQLLIKSEELAATGEELHAQFDALTESERTIRLSEERLIMAQEIGHTGCWEYDLVTDKIWSSAEGLRLFGFPPVAGAFPIDDIEACIPERERVHAALIDLINAGKEYNLEYTINPRDGSAPKVIYSIARLEKDAQGNPIRISGIIRDITERKVAEDALFRVNQKLNVISQLTRQDLTNQIFVLNSYLELTKNQLTGQDRVIETLKKGIQVIQSIHETIGYSKDYQDMGAKPPAWQNVNMALLFGLSHISIGNILHSLETENLEIFADPLLEKVCQRLFENSVKHGEHVIRIRVWYTTTPDGITIFFEDDGTGISAERKEQIFLRSESTRVSMRSLIFVREILDITGITIKETGEPGKGARFEMTVPNGAWRIKGK
jgi:signal transduction histidine kinase